MELISKGKGIHTPRADRAYGFGDIHGRKASRQYDGNFDFVDQSGTDPPIVRHPGGADINPVGSFVSRIKKSMDD